MSDQNLHFLARQRLIELLGTDCEGRLYLPIQQCLDDMQCAYAKCHACAAEAEAEATALRESDGQAGEYISALQIELEKCRHERAMYHRLAAGLEAEAAPAWRALELAAADNNMLPENYIGQAREEADHV